MTKILFVEDDALVAGIYSQKLTEEGFKVTIADDGLVAMRQLVDFKPDLVVLDLLLPKLNGVDVLDFMRGRDDLKSKPVIVFSNSYLSGLIEQAETRHVEASLLKSRVTPAGLVEVVHKILGNSVTPAAAPVSAAVPAVPPAPAAPAPKPASRPVFLTFDEPAPSASVVPATPPCEPAAAKESDSEFQARIRREFLERIPQVFRGARQLCHQFLEAADSSAQTKILEDLCRKIGFLTQMTSMAGYPHFAELSDALEALLFELKEKTALITDSCRQTLIATVAFLAERLESIDTAGEQGPWSSSILVVDDDAVSNRATVMALGRAKLVATSVADPFEAIRLLQQNSYGLMLLDIKMPGMDGLALCEQIRNLPQHKRTPIVFVTSLTDFKTWARAILSGGNDVITKPILPVELCVKVLTLLLKSRS